MTVVPAEGHLLPMLQFPTADGGQLRLTAYRGRANLALFVFPQGDSPRARASLAAIQACLPAYQTEHSQPLALLSVPLPVVQAIQAELGLTFPVLAGSEDKISDLLGLDDMDQAAEPRVILTDRYREVRVHQSGWEAVAPGQQADLLNRLRYLDCLCSC